jgi:hypothetical protein
MRKPTPNEVKLYDDYWYSVAKTGVITDESDSTVRKLIREGRYYAVRDGRVLKVAGYSIRKRMTDLPRA